MRRTVAKRLRKEAARIAKLSKYKWTGKKSGTLMTNVDGFVRVYRAMKKAYTRNRSLFVGR